MFDVVQTRCTSPHGMVQSTYVRTVLSSELAGTGSMHGRLGGDFKQSPKPSPLHNHYIINTPGLPVFYCCDWKTRVRPGDKAICNSYITGARDVWHLLHQSPRAHARGSQHEGVKFLYMITSLEIDTGMRQNGWHSSFSLVISSVQLFGRMN